MTDTEKLAAIRPILETLQHGPPMDWPGETDYGKQWEMCRWTSRHAADALRIANGAA